MAAGDQRLRALVADYFGGHARVRLLRPTAVFGAPVFVVDFDRGVRHYRTLGSFGPDQQVTEQSSMDLIYPAHLVFHYERLMSLAMALCDRPISALLLGVGGAAMWRFVRAYLPECAMTLVDSDDAVINIARRWFFLNQRVALEDAQQFVAATRARFDAVLIDLYHAGGPAEMGAPFWTRCLDALAPGGCLANNWADFATNPAVKPMADTLSAVARSRGLESIFVTRRGFRDNLVQYVPTAAGVEATAITAALERFAHQRRLPDRGRGILENCLVGTEFPIL
jgi:trans-aconitate methyltransferase